MPHAGKMCGHISFGGAEYRAILCRADRKRNCAWQESFLAGSVPAFLGASFSAGTMLGFDVARDFETGDPILFALPAQRNFRLAEDEVELFLTPRAGFTFMTGGMDDIREYKMKCENTHSRNAHGRADILCCQDTFRYSEMNDFLKPICF